MERRKNARLNVELDVSYKNRGEEKPKNINAKNCNISADGICINSAKQIEEGTKVDIEVFLSKEKDKSFKTTGTVVWQKKISAKSYIIGIKIEKLGEKEMELFTELVFEKMHRMVREGSRVRSKGQGRKRRVKGQGKRIEDKEGKKLLWI